MDDSDGDEPVVSIPTEFFRKTLPAAADLAELKIVLHVYHLVSQRGTPGVPLDDLLTAPIIRSVAGPHSPEPGEVRLQRTLDRAVASALLLRMSVRSSNRLVIYYLPATERNRSLLERLRQD